jgi:hypothetical protein
MKNTVDQRQFRGGYAPQQPVDESNRAYKKEPNPPESRRIRIQKQKKRGK